MPVQSSILHLYDVGEGSVKSGRWVSLPALYIIDYRTEKMRYVEFYDWQYGYRKISSTKLFQEHFGMGLKEAHERTNTLLDKQSFILPVESAEKANEVIKHFTEIRVLCRLVEPA